MSDATQPPDCAAVVSAPAAAGAAPVSPRTNSPGASPHGSTHGSPHLSGAELTSAVDGAPDGIVVTDGTGTVTFVNAAALRMTGRAASATDTSDADASDADGSDTSAADDAVGRPLADVLPLVDRQGRDWWSCTDPFGGLAIRTRQPERLLSLADGRKLLVTVAYLRAGGPGTDLTQLVVGLRHVTPRTQVDRSAAELVAVAAHELRSPLTSIKGFTSTLLAKWDLFTDEQRRLMLETVDADAHRLTRLIGDLLDVARIDIGQLALRPQWLDVASHARRAVARLVGNGARADRFVVTAEPSAPQVWADPDKIERVLLNLVENAVRHGGGTVTIEVVGVAPERNAVAGGPGVGHGVEVAVSDEGAGVPEQLTASAFEKFSRAGNDGAGLGLYVARGIVDAHGGTIGVDRADSGGARFRFRLPVGRPDPSA